MQTVSAILPPGHAHLIPPGPEQGSGRWAWLALQGCLWPCRAEHPSTPHPQNKTVTAVTPNLFRELPVNWNQTCLEFQRGIVSIFHTGLVIYNSLRELTLRLRSSDNPPKMNSQARGQSMGGEHGPGPHSFCKSPDIPLSAHLRLWGWGRISPTSGARESSRLMEAI